jgi:hypothetical protein
VRSVWTNSVRNAFRKQAGWAKLQEVRATEAKHWTDRVWYCHTQRWMRSSKERTEASRSGSFKNGQEWGKKCFEDLEQRRMGRPATCTWSTDFLLREGSSPRRNREMVKKQVRTMATAEKIASGGGWYISFWTADAKVWVQKNGGVHVVSEGASGVWKQLERRAAEGDNRPHSERGVSWTKGAGHRRAQMRASGSCYKKSMCMEGG